MVSVATDNRGESVTAYYLCGLAVVQVGNDFLSKRQFLVLELYFLHSLKFK